MPVLVAGPPCAGKTTFALEQGGTVLDWDDVFEEVTGLPRYEQSVTRPWPEVEALFRRRVLDGPAWIIRTLPSKRHRAMLRRMWGVTSVVLLTPPGECIRRMEASRPEHTWPSTEAAILGWWREYEPSSSPDEMVVG